MDHHGDACGAAAVLLLAVERNIERTAAAIEHVASGIPRLAKSRSFDEQHQDNCCEGDHYKSMV
jgi:hypothetical protein